MVSISKNGIIQAVFYIILFGAVFLLFHHFSVQNSNRIQEQTRVYAEDASMQTAARIDEQFQSALDLIKTYSYFLEDILKMSHIPAEVLKDLEKNSPFDVLCFADRNGVNLASNGDISDAKHREYFIEGMKGVTGISTIAKSNIYKRSSLVVYTPLKYNGEIVGVLHGTYIADKDLLSIMETTYFGVPTKVFLCTPNREIILSSMDADFSAPVLEYLENAGIIDAESVEKGRKIFQDGGSEFFLCQNGSTDDISIVHLPAFNYYLVQTFPQIVTRKIITEANNTGIQLEFGLISLFSIYIIFLIINTSIQKKKLEKENQELGNIIKGINILFASRYCVVDTVKKQFNYIFSQDMDTTEIGHSGDYQTLVNYLGSKIVPAAREDFEKFYQLDNLTNKLVYHDYVIYESKLNVNGMECWDNLITICLERDENNMPVKILFVRQDITEKKTRDLEAKKTIATMSRKERQYRIAIISNALYTYEFNVTRDLIEKEVNIDKRLTHHIKEKLVFPCKASDFFEAIRPIVMAENFSEYDKIKNVKYLQERFEAGEQEIDIDYWVRDERGEEICIRQIFYLARDEITNDIMAMTITRDITAQVTKQRLQTKALQDALMQAQHANAAKTTFLSNMSHDIRTPMNAIIGFASIAAAHLENKNQVRDCLEKVLSSSNHLLSLINDILDMSRIESGKMQIKVRECNISELMHNLVNIIQPQAKAKQLQLFIDTYGVVNEDIIADPLKVNQILINLLGNAVKYTPSGGTIVFRISQKPAFRHGYADYVFEVRDTGIGMDEEFARHIFEPFTRETAVTRSGIQGSGLGMAITKNIVEMMGGQINVQTQQGKGSVFIVTLSFRIQMTEQENVEIGEFKGQRALVVDDDFHICDSVDKMLKKIGLRSEWTTSGREAVYRAQIAMNDKDPYETYIIDWQMPDMNGIETAKNIRRITGADTPIIILTAYEWIDIEEEALAAGVTTFCAKPLFMSDLKHAFITCHRPKPLPEAAEVSKEQFVGKRILLVDDLEMNREVAEFILTEHGFEVETAPDGTDAVEMVRKSPEGYYDAILMDVQMPTMDGYEATKAIRGMERSDAGTIPIIAMTANAFEEDKVAAIKSGMNDHIAKPIDIDVFMDVIKKFFV